ncbi:class I SAM-dependent methyltransferase [Alphaproteobacteria bacterium]|nr:class I SAM-dependent methyltransferase [Alphaproteobacteria bacterium]
MTLINNYICCLCESQLPSEVILTLPETPLANNFSINKQTVETYPLNIVACTECCHVQLREKVDPNIIFKNYLYKSGISKTFVKHFMDYVNTVTSDLNIKKTSKVLEIGANDGTLITLFYDQGFKNLYAIEPASNLAPKSKKKNIEWICEFFNLKYSKTFLGKFGKMDLICANNVLAHSPNLFEIFKGISEILEDDGILTFEVSYLMDLVKNCFFDMIYHEHYSYHHLLPLYQILPKYGLNLYDVEKISTHGGSIRCFVSKTKKEPSKRLISMITQEHSYFNDLKHSFSELDNKITLNANSLTDKILINNNFSNNIIGFGAPAKFTTLFYRFNLLNLKIKCIIDDNDLKIDKFTPGTNIPIVSYDEIKKHLPAIVIVFAWNFFEIIALRLKKDFGDQVFIINPMEN